MEVVELWDKMTSIPCSDLEEGFKILLPKIIVKRARDKCRGDFNHVVSTFPQN
ncbi:hypothetical protein EXN66_Car020845 [Channa argus]|uniref:Uncharacterized protein n=1 Tax=Channa argus TaxID=215402 RepID=A0A6G1QRN8_CHAAH|nr:hypothetical protein EXN66_Car020845 [Channa argus]